MNQTVYILFLLLNKNTKNNYLKQKKKKFKSAFRRNNVLTNLASLSLGFLVSKYEKCIVLQTFFLAHILLNFYFIDYNK